MQGLAFFVRDSSSSGLVLTMHQISRRAFTLSLAGAFASRGQSSENVAALTLSEAAARIRSRAVTSVQLTEACLARIETYNPKLNAFITVLRDQAIIQARDLD